MNMVKNYLQHLLSTSSHSLLGFNTDWSIFPPQELPYLRESIAHPFRCFLRPKNRVHIRIDGALDVHAKS